MASTMQLEFAQAMTDFKNMFPEMDRDVIEAVLRANQGAVDATIDQLLAMSTDNQVRFVSFRRVFITILVSWFGENKNMLLMSLFHHSERKDSHGVGCGHGKNAGSGRRCPAGPDEFDTCAAEYVTQVQCAGGVSEDKEISGQFVQRDQQSAKRARLDRRGAQRAGQGPVEPQMEPTAAGTTSADVSPAGRMWRVVAQHRVRPGRRAVCDDAAERGVYGGTEMEPGVPVGAGEGPPGKGFGRCGLQGATAPHGQDLAEEVHPAGPGLYLAAWQQQEGQRRQTSGFVAAAGGTQRRRGAEEGRTVRQKVDRCKSGAIVQN